MRKTITMICLCLISLLANAQVKNAGCLLRLSEPISNDELLWENDSLKVKFDFNEMNYFVRINIYNKTPETISIDWDKFVIIRGKTSYPVIFDNTIMLQKDQPKGKSTIATGSMVWKNISSVMNVEYNMELYKKKDVKRCSSTSIGFVVPIVFGDQTKEYRFTIDVTAQ